MHQKKRKWNGTKQNKAKRYLTNLSHRKIFIPFHLVSFVVCFVSLPSLPFCSIPFVLFSFTSFFVRLISFRFRFASLASVSFRFFRFRNVFPCVHKFFQVLDLFQSFQICSEKFGCVWMLLGRASKCSQNFWIFGLPFEHLSMFWIILNSFDTIEVST